MGAMLAFVGVTLTVNGSPLLSDFSCALAPGDCVVVPDTGNAGPALLSLLLRERAPSAGAVEADGVNIATLPPAVLRLYRQRIGPVFDSPRLLGDLTVLENVMFPAELRGTPRAQARSMALALLSQLSVATVAGRFPAALSQREQRIVAFARALCGSPPILALCEPLIGIDAPTRERMLQLLAEAQAAKMSVLVITAEPAAYAALTTRTVAAPAPVKTAAPAATGVKITAVAGS